MLNTPLFNDYNTKSRVSINSTKHIIIADNYVNGLPVFLTVVERVEIYYQGTRFFELSTVHEKSNHK